MKREPEPDVYYAIEMTTLCQVFNTLPRAGGLFDQDPRDVHMMRIVLEAQQEKQEAERKR